jgi:peptidoglycan/LPS O-acetylase OafA/YrhL
MPIRSLWVLMWPNRCLLSWVASRLVRSVMIFFSISGFFITRSFAGQASLARFLQARCLRLFPALIVVSVVTVLVAGFWLTTGPQTVFWAAAPEYILRNITLFSLTYDLPGVFAANVYGPAINGSLWTLSYEVLCYLGVVVAGLAGLLTRPRLFALALTGFAVVYGFNMVHPMHTRIDSLLMLALPFAIGTAFWVWRKVIPLSAPLAVVLFGIAYLTRQTALLEPVLAMAYSMFVIGYAQSPVLAVYNRLGDYSYGTYVYAFPIQQLLASLGIMSPLTNIALALPATLICAVLSWHLVEAPAMRLKPAVLRPRPA